MELKERSEPQLSTQVSLLVHDGECRLCVSVKQKLEECGFGRVQSEVRFLPYQSEAARKALGQDYRPGRPDMAFLIRPSGEVFQGLEAFLPLIPKLPGGKHLLWWFRYPSAKRLAKWGYGIVARHRYRWFGEAEQPHQPG